MSVLRRKLECEVSTSAIIRGTSFNIESLPDARQELMIFESDSGRFAVEVHTKLN